MSSKRLVDLSHVLYHDMPIHPWMPQVLVSEYISREQSAKFLADGVSFSMVQVTMPGSTGTFLQAPFQYHEDGPDIGSVPLNQLVDLPIVVVAAEGQDKIGPELFEECGDLAGAAVLVRTGHDRYWGTEPFYEHTCYLTAEAAKFLIDARPALVGIDSKSVDNGADQAKPVHHGLLGAGIVILTSVTRLERLPARGALLTVLPVPARGMGSFPVRAVATVES
ncbi:cyclase family protein [Amycolatopsis sp. VC5-11]|uniref:cyclase family protein n=1 Tax=Amycolatopsis sp. VC5-11 TaxID=3120156 RepID=UPI00300B1E6E